MLSGGCQPDGHAVMSGRRLGRVGAAESVPQGKGKAEIGIGLFHDDGMMNPVHVRGDEKKADEPVNFGRNVNIGVVEHGRGIEQNFKGQHRPRRESERGHGSQLDEQRNNDSRFAQTNARTGSKCGYKLRRAV